MVVFAIFTVTVPGRRDAVVLFKNADKIIIVGKSHEVGQGFYGQFPVALKEPGRSEHSFPENEFPQGKKFFSGKLPGKKGLTDIKGPGHFRHGQSTKLFVFAFQNKFYCFVG
jgi:hypothetical protein